LKLIFPVEKLRHHRRNIDSGIDIPVMFEPQLGQKAARTLRGRFRFGHDAMHKSGPEGPTPLRLADVIITGL
jgi:hypothetical protein